MNIIFALFFISIISNSYAQTTRAKYDEVKQYLEKLKADISVIAPYQRPENCPLKPVKLKDLLQNVNTLRDSFQKECQSKNEAVINQLNNSTDQLNGLLSSLNNNGENKLYNNQNLSTAISSIGSLASKEECFYDIKKNGALPVLSDVVLSVSQLGLIVPSSNGLVLAAGGALFSSVLTIIDQVLRNKLDWNIQQERAAFAKFNCSFFELRKELVDSGLMTIPTDKLNQRLSNDIEILEELKLKLEQLQLEQKELEEILKSNLAEFLFNTFGKINEDALKTSMIWQEIISKTIIDDEFSKRTLIGNLVIKSKNFYELVESANLSEDLNVFKTDMLKTIQIFIRDQSDISELLEMDLAEFKILEQKISYYVDLLTVDLLNQKNDLIKGWNEQVSVFGDSTNEQDLSEIEKAYSKLTEKVQNKINHYDNLVNVNKQLLGVEDFKDNDEAAGTKLDIILSYQEIQEQIYGKVGWSFMKYLLKEGDAARRYFNNNARKFNINGDDKAQNCRNAINLTQEWVKTKSYAEEANNFIYTNFGIFHEYTKKYRSFLLIPTGKSPEIKLRAQVESLKSLENFNNGTATDQDNKRLKRRNLGRLIHKVSIDGEKSKIIQDYIKDNSCENMI